MKFLTEVLKLLLVLFIATGGSAITLIVDGVDAAREAVISVAGMIFSPGYWYLLVYLPTKA